MVHDHLVAVAPAGKVRKCTCLVRVKGVVSIIHPDENVLCLGQERWWVGTAAGCGSWWKCGFGALHSLALAMHVTLLCFF